MTGTVHALRCIPKNRKGEEIRLSVETYNGTKLLNLRVWYPTEEGEMRPGRQGLSMRVELAEEVRDALISIVEEGYDDR